MSRFQRHAHPIGINNELITLNSCTSNAASLGHRSETASAVITRVRSRRAPDSGCVNDGRAKGGRRRLFFSSDGRFFAEEEEASIASIAFFFRLLFQLQKRIYSAAVKRIQE